MAKQSQNDAHSGLFGAVFDNADVECIAIVGTIVFKMATKKKMLQQCFMLQFNLIMTWILHGEIFNQSLTNLFSLVQRRFSVVTFAHSMTDCKCQHIWHMFWPSC